MVVTVPKASRLSTRANKLKSADFIASGGLSYETYERHPSHPARQVSILGPNALAALEFEKSGAGVAKNCDLSGKPGMFLIGG